VKRRSFLAEHFRGTEIITVVTSPIAQKWTEASPTQESDNITNILDNRTCVISDKHDTDSLPWSFSPTFTMLLDYRPLHPQPGRRRQFHTSGTLQLFILLMLMCMVTEYFFSTKNVAAHITAQQCVILSGVSCFVGMQKV